MPSVSFVTSFGQCGIVWDNGMLTSSHLPDDTAYAHEEAPMPDWIAAIISRVQRHFDGDLQDFADLPYDFSRVTPFQHAVYSAALTVKPGETQSYGWLARKIGRDHSASRAIGSALGRNPWLLLVPCHRFLSASGKLTGFSGPGGIETKQRLLSLEHAKRFVSGTTR